MSISKRPKTTDERQNPNIGPECDLYVTRIRSSDNCWRNPHSEMVRHLFKIYCIECDKTLQVIEETNGTPPESQFCCDNCWKEQWHFVKFHLKWNCFSISISNIFRNNWMLIRRLLRWDTLQNEHSLENKFHPGAPRPHLPQANKSILSSFILDALRTFPIQNRLENHRKLVEEHQN